MEEYVPTTPFVSERLNYAKKLIKESEELVDKLRKPVLNDAGEQLAPAKISYAEAGTILSAHSVLMQLVYGLDEAMKALNVYADVPFWKEVPEHSYAASDLGTRAKVALARIDPV